MRLSFPNIFAHRSRTLAVAVVVTLLGAGLTATAASGARKLDKVTLQLGWLPKVEYAFIYSGKDIGIFEKHGIALNVVTGKGSALAMNAVRGGQADFGYTGGPSYFVADSKGFPLVMTAVFLQENPEVLISWPSNPLTSLKGLEGKRLILVPGDGFTAALPALAKINGVDLSKVTTSSLGNSAYVQAFLAHQGDVTSYYVTSGLVSLEKQAGTKLTVLPAKSFGFDLLSNGLFTTKAKIKNNPDLVRRMTAAMVESWNWTKTHIHAAAKIILAQLPGYQLGDVMSTIHQTAKLAHTPASKGLPTGCMAPSDWVASQKLMLQSGQMSKALPATDYYTNQFVPGCMHALAKKTG